MMPDPMPALDSDADCIQVEGARRNGGRLHDQLPPFELLFSELEQQLTNSGEGEAGDEMLALLRRVYRDYETERSGARSESDRRDEAPQPSASTTAIVGNSEVLLRVLRQAEQAAGTDSTILILGETGTGKEMLAHHLHSRSRRSGKPFITTNIAAIPGTLLESELFGREKGAYTGAMTRQAGRFELADGGTLFLDEIGEMPMETQAKLLRVLQSGELERLGSGRTQYVNVRVIAATNRRLPDLIQARHFREDLFYRLNVFPITLPPLRDRLEDLPLLIWSFIKDLSERMGKPIERVRQSDLNALREYNWPGNVRELRNIVERSMILAQGPELRLEFPEREPAHETPADSWKLRDVQRQHIVKVLHLTKGRLRGPGGAAQILDMKPTTLYSLMNRLGIARNR